MSYDSRCGKFDPDRDAGPRRRYECDGTKKAGAEYLLDISATRLSHYETL